MALRMEPRKKLA